MNDDEKEKALDHLDMLSKRILDGTVTSLVIVAGTSNHAGWQEQVGRMSAVGILMLQSIAHRTREAFVGEVTNE